MPEAERAGPLPPTLKRGPTLAEAREGHDTGTRCTYPRAPAPRPCQAPGTGPGRRPAGSPPGGKYSGPCSAPRTSSSAAAAAPAPHLLRSPCEAAREGGQVRSSPRSTPSPPYPADSASLPSCSAVAAGGLSTCRPAQPPSALNWPGPETFVSGRCQALLSRQRSGMPTARPTAGPPDLGHPGTH